MVNSRLLLNIAFCLFTFAVSLAQESKAIQYDTIQTSNSYLPNAPQAEEGDVKISDGTNTLIRITDEGNFGAIEIKSGVPTTPTNKLYNKDGVLHYNGSPINSAQDNDWAVSGNNIYSQATGNVGIGINNASEKLEVVGKIKSSELQITTGAADGHVLTSDVNGNATWQELGGSGLNLSIGDSYQGGIIFWLDGSGEHGLIAEPSDIATEYWYLQTASTDEVPYGYARGIYSGEINTELLVINSTECKAASYCYNKVSDGYSDWYLPSLDEALLMMKNLYLNGYGNFSDNSSYWTSSQSDEFVTTTIYAYSVNLTVPTSSTPFSKSSLGASFSRKVRAIRKF